MEKEIHMNSNQKRAGVVAVAIPVANATLSGFKVETINRDKGHFIMIKWVTHQEIILNVFAPNKDPKIQKAKTDRIKERSRKFINS